MKRIATREGGPNKQDTLEARNVSSIRLSSQQAVNEAVGGHAEPRARRGRRSHLRDKAFQCRPGEGPAVARAEKGGVLRPPEMLAAALAEVKHVGGELFAEQSQGPKAPLGGLHGAPNRPPALDGVETEGGPELEPAEEA